MPFKPGDRVRSVRHIGVTLPIAIGSVGTVDSVFDFPPFGRMISVTTDTAFEGDATLIESFEDAWEAEDATR